MKFKKKSKNNNVMVEEKKNQQEAIFCAGLFSLIRSAVKGGHYVTSSAHTWPTV